MRFQRPDHTARDFQLAPMVDILFILLIFFILTSSYQAIEKELSVALPDASNSKEIEQLGRDIIINITRDGRYIVNRKEYSLEALRDLLARTKDVLGTRTVLIRADEATIYEDIVRVMDLCAELKITKLSFVTQEAKREN